MTDQLCARAPATGLRQQHTGSGLACGVGAYTIWGLFPAFFGLLTFADPIDILAHRVAWTLALMVALTALTRQLGLLRGLPPRTWLLIAAGAVFISLNWGTYIFAVLSGHVAEGALGYFINPLLSVALGVIIFRERLRPLPIGAIALAAVAVIVLTVAYNRLPAIALTLAGSFALYGVVKKLTPLPPQVSLTAETIVIAPLALSYLGPSTILASHTQTPQSPMQLTLLMLTGPVTAAPLLLFGAAAHRLPVVSLGVLQYLTPVLQLIWAVAVSHEHLSATTWLGFALVWAALLMFTVDVVLQLQRRTRCTKELPQ